ncbi:MAG: thioredoxin family protein [Acidobacteriota bacterium]
MRSFWILALAVPVVPCAAATSDWEVNPESCVRLVSDRVRGSTLSLGLEVHTEPGWHVYWKNSGDAGFPPVVKVGGPGIAGSELLWPAPHRYALRGGLVAFGYEDEVVYPIEVGLMPDAAPATVVADVDYLVCQEECVPYHYLLRIDAPFDGDAESSRLVREALDAVPGPLQIDRRVEGRLEQRGDELVIVLDASVPVGDVFFAPLDDYEIGAPVIASSLRGAHVEVRLLPKVHGREPMPVRVEATLTGVSGGQAVTVPLLLSPRSAAASLAGMLLFAFLGGAILNLMPCVLPVLSLKVFGLLKQAGEARARVRAGALLTALGILLSFLALAALAIVLRAAGRSAGWGIQFQEPLFVTFLTLVVTLFALNLWGLFELHAPGAISRIASLGPRAGAAGHVASGFFATLLATPCSAPFLGTSIAFALSQPAPRVIATFTAVGTGMAAPYLLLAIAPGALRILPKPGAWMESLRRVLGFFMAATAVWLLYVLSGQVDPAGVATVEIGLLGMGLAATLARGGSRRAMAILVAGLLVASTGAMTAAHLFRTSARPGETAASSSGWVPFDRSRVEELVSQGVPVFVDVTADWCFTCKANERLVLARADVAAAFSAKEVVTMRADWTSRDPAIAAYLASFDRYGIPFYVYYAPSRPPRLLPEVLTPGTVLDALRG